MKENIIKETKFTQNNEAPTLQEPERVKKQLITLKGTLTSQIQIKSENAKEPYYYAFIRLKGQTIDLPVIFKIKDNQEKELVGEYDPAKLIKPNLKKSDQLELIGYYSISEKSVRKSFTAISYQLLNEKRIRKKCTGCLDTFTCSQKKNYDYCKNCELNGSRYAQNKCPECGDGSGLVKFPNQPPRNCKTCYLFHQEQKLFPK